MFDERVVIISLKLELYSVNRIILATIFGMNFGASRNFMNVGKTNSQSDWFS